MPLPRTTPIPLQPRSGSGSTNSTSHSPHPYGGDARCVSCKILKTASRAVLSRWTRRPRSTGPDEVAQVLGLIDAAVHDARFEVVSADAPRPKVDQRVHSSLGRRLLEQVRGEVVETWSDARLPDAALLTRRVAIERIRVPTAPTWAKSSV